MSKNAKKIPVYKMDGSQNGEIELNDLVFGARVNDRLLQLAVVAYAGNQRRGTHDTKERKEVQGGGKKPWKQKGTGRARQGSIRAPQWRGGGTVFGPTPRDYDTALPQTMRNKALISALSLKTRDEKITIVEDFSIDKPKTKELLQVLKNLKLDQAKTLFVAHAVSENLKRAANNVKEIFLIKPARDLNAYHVMRKTQLVIEKSALPVIEKRVLELSEPSSEKELVAA